ncbi:glycosyltransferase family 9 protein [Haloferula chungangensis]|uniref:Glycosyltransferase family 9 protein n=1 Tax=Haloferula chungangensis TaxID=1048331 RepID=A0ABW2L4R6_9BACT
MPDSSSSVANAEPLLIAAPLLWKDACFSLPAVRSLAAAGNPISILCPEAQRKFWEAAGFDALTCYPAGASARAIASLINHSPRALLWEAGPAADACAKAGVRERMGLPSAKLAKRLTNTLERKVKPGPTEHEVTRFLEIAKLLDAQPMKSEHFAPIPCEKGNASLLVVPESDYPAIYEWPRDRWIELIQRLKGQGSRPIIGILGSSGAAQEIATQSGCETIALDLADPRSFASHERILAADGSLPHIAAAFGTTCAVLYGPADPELSRPLGKQHLIIRRKVECSPCFLRKCPIDLRCQMDLDIDRVMQRFSTLSPA